MSAVISDRGKYRYQLFRDLGEGAGGPIVWVMLNPSTADAEKDDATIRRLIGFTRLWKNRAFYVVNLYAYRATDPRELKNVADAIGLKNDSWINHTITQAKKGNPNPYGVPVICGWGAHAKNERAETVLQIIREAGGNPLALGFTKSGQPVHPLYQSYDAVLRRVER